MTFNQPLSLLPLQAGIIVTPRVEDAAQGARSLDGTLSAVVIGEPIPIVFCRRRDSIGGVFVSPQVTEGRFTNNATTNELTVYYELILSEGDMPQLQQNDCWQGACRVGTWTQSYDTRANTWTAGNLTTVVAGKTAWSCPTFCGSGGTYDNLTTLSFTYSYPDGSNNWNKQVHVFVRQGLIVTRIMDSVVGSSDNFIDLAKYLITQTSRLPASMIDNTQMLAAATFLDANNFRYNGLFNKSSNLEDWMSETAFGFLLKPSDNNGKKAFRPMLPTNANGTIKTTAITPEYTFTEEEIIPDGFEIEYIPLSERKPIAALMLWRQQPENSIELIRSTEVRLPDTAVAGPYEQYDLSEYCVTEIHAVKVGTYIVGKRYLVKHALRIKARPGAYSSTLTTGDIVRVRLQRQTSVDATSWHDYFYEVERIAKGTTGIVQLDLIHFPVDNQGRSLLALLVNGATASGYSYPTGSGSYTCDVNDPNDPTPLPDVPGTPITPPDSPDVPEPGKENEPPELPPVSPNPPDPLDTPPAPTICGATGDTPLLGDTLSVCAGGCANPITNWYLVDGSGNATLVSANTATYYIDANNAASLGKTVYVETCCPDSSTPSGYAACQQSAQTAPIGGAWTQPGTGTYTVTGTWTTTVSQAILCSSGNPGQAGSVTTQSITSRTSASNAVGYRYIVEFTPLSMQATSTVQTTCTGDPNIFYQYTKRIQFVYANGSVSTQDIIWSSPGGNNAVPARNTTQSYTTTWTDNLTVTVT